MVEKIMKIFCILFCKKNNYGEFKMQIYYFVL